MIEQEITVAAPVDRTWRVWTEQIDLWWPPDHRPGGGLLVLERCVGGRLFLRSESGDELELGRVRTWDPPHCLGYDFYLGSSTSEPSSVEVRFTPVADGTRVEVVHARGLVPLARWAKSSQGYARAWPALFASFTRSLQELP